MTCKHSLPVSPQVSSVSLPPSLPKVHTLRRKDILKSKCFPLSQKWTHLSPQEDGVEWLLLGVAACSRRGRVLAELRYGMETRETTAASLSVVVKIPHQTFFHGYLSPVQSDPFRVVSHQPIRLHIQDWTSSSVLRANTFSMGNTFSNGQLFGSWPYGKDTHKLKTKK